jgi:hypothetical protein
MLASLLKRIEAWTKLGCKESADGSRLVGHTPRDFPEAYLHRFFAPRSRTEWQAYGVNLPKSLQELYSECNGFSLFHGALETYGIRAHYKRYISAQFQPFDLITHDREHRNIWHPLPKQSPDQRVFFGGYGDGSGIFVVGESPSVYRVVRNKSAPSNEWTSIQNFLKSEFDRINKLFTPEGYLLRTNLRTAPDRKTGK